jgi:lysophospholipase L1-like esterase
VSLAKNLLLALGSALLTLAAVEAASRWLRPTPLPAPVHGSGAVPLLPDQRLFFRMPAGRREPPITNSWGLRGPEPGPKTSEVFRILSLGESSTFGWELAADETYSALLERSLAEIDGRRVQVVNAGVPAYTSFQGWLFLESRGPALEPDAVLFYFGANDFPPTTFSTTRSGAPDERVELTDRALHAERQRLRSRLSYALLTHSNLFRIAALPDADPVALEAGAGSRVPPEDVRWVLGRVRAWCAERGVRLAVLVPWYREFHLHTGVLRELRGEPDVLLIDLPWRLRSLPEPREDHFMDAIHPNVRGQEQIARVVAEDLVAHWGARPARDAQP